VNFVGRTRELDSLAAALRTDGLVTVTGPPGVGKSAVLREALRTHRGPLLLVELDGACSEADLARRVFEASGLPVPAEPNVAAAALALARRRQVAAFDDADEVGSALTELLTRWFRNVPGATAVVTRGERLGLARERVIPVAPFAVESETEGVQLFVGSFERSQRHALGDESNDAVLRIVRVSEGLPLVIVRAAELAALIGVGEVASISSFDEIARIEQEHYDELARHRSAAAAFARAWSRFGGASEVRGVRLLSLFREEFDVETAHALVGGSRADCRALLARWVERSCLLVDATGRFRFVSGFRHIAEQELEASADAEPGWQRLIDYLALQAERAHADGVDLTRPNGMPRTARAALERALSCGRVAAAAHILMGLGPVYLNRGPLDELLRLLERVDVGSAALSRSTAGSLALLNGLALLFSGQRERSFSPFQVAQRLGTRADRATALSYLGLVAGLGGDFRRAGRYLERAETAASSGLAPLVEARVLKNAANVLAEEGHESALGVIRRASDAFQRGGDERGCGFMLLLEASVLLDDQQLEAAGRVVDQASALLERVGDDRSSAWAACIRATIDRDAARFELAREGYRRSVDTFRRVKDEQTLGIVLGLFVALELEQQHADAALELAAQAIPLLERADDREHLALLHALSACGLARLGRRHEAEAELRRARTVLPRRGRTARRAAIAILSLALSTPAERERQLELQSGASGEESRSALRIVRAFHAHEVPELRQRVLEVAPGSRHAVTADGTHVDLAARPVARRLLEVLVRERERAPGMPVSAERLLRQAWPNQSVARAVALNRLYVALNRLRASGFGRSIQRTRDGWLIPREVSVVRINLDR